MRYLRPYHIYLVTQPVKRLDDALQLPYTPFPGVYKVPAGNMATLTNFLKFLKNYLKVSGQTVHGSKVSCYTSYIKR